MQPFFYARTWQNGVHMDCYTHRIKGYRYNWHNDMYEINIVVIGSMEFCCGGQIFLLKQGDIAIINPGIGHASFCMEPNSISLVFHISETLFHEMCFKKKESCDCFFISSDATRHLEFCKWIRRLCSKIILSLAEDQDEKELITEGGIKMIAGILYGQFHERAIEKQVLKPTVQNKTMKQMIQYIEQNYQDKLLLETLAEKFGYNRTYLSSFFKKNLGTGFYNYLQKVRFQQAIMDLSTSPKSLTQIALDHGFPDLKTFNKMFYSNFSMMPAEYQNRLSDNLRPDKLSPRYFLDARIEEIEKSLKAFMS